MGKVDLVSSSQEGVYIGIVQSKHDGHKGRYAVTEVEGIEGTVTFSLKPPVWKESGEPENGHAVVLEDISRKRAGWKAGVARLYRPHDSNLQGVSTKGG